jgi:hypothetical protein
MGAGGPPEMVQRAPGDDDERPRGPAGRGGQPKRLARQRSAWLADWQIKIATHFDCCRAGAAAGARH